MAMSIAHRISGVALYLGTILLAGWLLAVASGPEAYQCAQAVVTSIPGRVVMVGYSWALLHHMLGGLRHFIWDLGFGFELGTVEWMARATIAGSFGLTILVWFIGYAVL